jgi:SPP1 family predicted phage head-tail adaptor
MRAGDLRHQITVLRSSQTQNAYGEIQNTWAEHLTCRGFVRPLTGKEVVSGQFTISEVTHKIFTRYQEIRVTDRIAFEGRTFDIKSVINHEEKGVMLEIVAKEQYI